MEYIFILIGFAAGVIGTIVGAGGGFVLVPFMLIFYPQMEPDKVTGISLAMIAANSISGSIAYARMKRINYRAGGWFAAATVPGAVIGAVLISYIKADTFRAMFGGLLLVISAYLLVNPKKEKHSEIIDAADFKVDGRGLAIGAILSLGVGLLSSILGIGGGVIHVPVLIYMLAFPVHLATATSHFVLAVMASAATVVHAARGDLVNDWLLVVMLIIGVIPGAQVGAKLSNRFKSAATVKALACALGLSAIRILWAAMK